MRILIYGAGVLGCNLASNLYRSKKDVTLLARGKWADILEEKGLTIQNKFRPLRNIPIRIIKELKIDDIYDVIFVVMRCSQLDSIINTLKDNGSKNIVFVGNNVRSSYYANLLSNKNVMFAFAQSAGHREPNRVVGIDMKKITIDQLKDAQSKERLINEIFESTGYKVTYEQNMEDYLLCHAAFVLPVAFACYYADGDLRKLKKNKNYLNMIIDANIEGYRAIELSGHEILPESDKNYESDSYRRSCYLFFKLICATPLGKICASDHAMNAIDEMSALNEDLKAFFEETGATYEGWRKIEETASKYLKNE